MSNYTIIVYYLNEILGMYISIYRLEISSILFAIDVLCFGVNCALHRVVITKQRYVYILAVSQISYIIVFEIHGSKPRPCI